MTERKMQRRTMHDFIMREAAVCGRMKPKEPHPMSEKPGDWAELAARADAHALPPSDYGSTRAIQSVAALLRAAYERGQSEAIAAWNRRSAAAPDPRDTEIATLRADLAAALEREGRLREALEPFADLCRTATIDDALSFAPHADCDLTVSRGWDNATIKASTFAAARAALAPAP